MSDQRYRVLNEIIVTKECLLHNYHYFSSLHSGMSIAPVVKSNAYGHGLVQIAKCFDELRPAMLCVDSLYEAYELFTSGITTPIFIMGYTNPVNYNVWKSLPFIFSVSDHQSVHMLSKYQPGARVHITVDTGMCRLGLQEHEVGKFIQTLKKYPNLRIEGIYSHLSQADDPKKATFTKKQISTFKRIVGLFEDSGYRFTWKHIAASAGIESVRDPYFTLARVGLGLYGYSPFSAHTSEGRKQRKHLQPALMLISHVAHVKHVFPGDMVGYGGTYRVKQNEDIAVLPIGYNEGLSRTLSNCGVVRVKDTYSPIIGRISMNMTTVKISRTIHVTSGDEVVVISPHTADRNSLYRLAQLEGTIPYTVLTALSPSIRRRII